MADSDLSVVMDSGLHSAAVSTTFMWDFRWVCNARQSSTQPRHPKLTVTGDETSGLPQPVPPMLRTSKFTESLLYDLDAKLLLD